MRNRIMPCSDGNYSELIAEENARKVNILTILLCEACILLSNPDQTDKMSDELHLWKIEHDKLDAERIRKEQEGLL